MQKIIDTLESLWLNEKEVKIYLASLSMWQTTASILWQKSWLARSTAQYTCNALVEKKLLNVIQKWNTFFYSPENPEKLISIINKEYTLLEKKMENTHKIMWYLKNLTNPYSKLPKVKYYTWVEWLINMFEDVLKENKTIYWALEISDDINLEIEKYLNEVYTIKRMKSWIKSYMLFNKWKKTLKYRENDSKVNRISLLIDNNNFPFESCLHIYWNKIAMYSYKNQDLVWVIIQNDFMKNTLFSIFKIAWNSASILIENEKYKGIQI